ncbi:hypothetical protein [Edaphobacter modestus]|uniref:Peptidase M1 membrane alanine aminopeptidase domain-containing protein n=1 Tax=Edaphobacter modestus TaxID=388466 RepID=A0A4Q7YYV3_9BACT|nr:hypothetical protein [Edaphobacter modestus]RZU42329.1 hypothetical protein BDD14_3894 [Edaphobacter modestus]
MIRSTILTVLLSAAAAGMAQQPAPSEPQGQVLFHRNEDPSAQPRSGKPSRTPEKAIAAITDAERSAIAFTAWDLDLHLAPATSHLAARARFTVRNISSAPVSQLALQVSSTLHWESLSAPIPLTLTEHVLATDADHTGQATEALVVLSRPIPPGSSLTLTGFYSGPITASGERLTRIGAPPDQAVNADWDQISPDIIALRGFGNVLWYPVSSPPLFLGDGARLFQAIGLSRLQQASSTVHLRLSIEYVGEPPVDAFLNGQRQPLDHVTEEPNAPVEESHGVATTDFPAASLGFRTPSLFVTAQASHPSENQLLQVTTTRPEAIAPFTTASTNVAPLLRDWLGPAPLTPLTLIDHSGQPFEEDAFLLVPLTATDARQITPAMVHSLAHAWFRSSLPWLNEGVPQFISLLYTESTDGRDKALAELRQLINPLTLVEPEKPAEEASTPPADFSRGYSSSSSSSSSPEPLPAGPPDPLPSTLPPPPGQPGQSLIAAHDEVYYRAKAAAVLWLLHSIVGDVPLKRGLQTYRDEVRHAAPNTPEDPHAFQRVLEAASHKDLSAIFDDWVYHDRGLADLSIVNVTPRDLPARNGKGVSWLVAVEIHNAGYVTVDVPVTVRSGTLTSTEKVHIPPRSSVSTRIVFEGVPQEIQVNDGTIPETTSPIHVREIHVAPAPI